MKIEKFRKLVACHTHTKFKTRTKLWSNIEKVHKATKFNQKAWPKPYIDFKSYKIIDSIKFYIKKVRKKIISKTIFSNWAIMRFSEKTMENVRNHGDIKLKTAEEGSNLISIRTKLSYNKKLSRQFISNRNERKTDTHE